MSIVNSYKKLVKNFKTNFTFDSYFPSPSETDYKKGYLYRYFVQKSNDLQSPIYEVNSQTYTRLSSLPDYTTISIRWRITGPTEKKFDVDDNIIDFGVRESNKRSVKLKSEIMPGLKYRLNNYLQFYKK